MRSMWLALALVCAASAAQAVSLKWDSNGAVGASSQTIFASGASKTSFSVAALITAVNLPSGNAVMMSFGSSSLAVLSYGSANGIGACFKTSASNAWSPNAPASASGQHVVALTFDWSESNNRWVINFYIDGKNMGFQDKTGYLNKPSGDLTITFAENAGWTFDDAAIYEGVLTAEELQTLQESKDMGSVPEPTALALLAFGAAALALRRRTA